MQNYSGAFYFGKLKPHISNTLVISSYFDLQLIFVPFNFAVLFGLRIRKIKGMPTLTVLQYVPSNILSKQAKNDEQSTVSTRTLSHTALLVHGATNKIFQSQLY